MARSKHPYIYQRSRYSRVTLARLTPEFERIFNTKSSEIALLPQAGEGSIRIPRRLLDALREHVFNNMPLRMIQLPDIKLVERDEVVTHIAAKMTAVNENMLSEMEKMIDILGIQSQRSLASELQETLLEEDVRERPWETICQFLFRKFARFAILSHTWYGKEIVYRDTLPGSQPYRNRPEYQKVENFCRITLKDHNISLAWIDTLCINKDSSSELDESIQSMYKWYRNSSICITHLRDTTSFDDMHLDNWFKRGWTLQELLAPKNMQFYYGDSWTRLTSSADGQDKAKPEIQRIIFRATNISATELDNFNPLAGSNVATRMSWAASRITTRGEDRAYSLMGVFGVNFTTSYGEGSERAFFRLIEAIISSRHTSHIIQVLNWGGDAISDTIHTSRLIPSGPECYLIEEAQAADTDFTTTGTTTYFPTLSKPMTLTHLGLRVRLLLVQVHVISVLLHYDATRKSGPFDVTMKLEFPPESFETVDILLQKRFSKKPSQISAFYNPLAPPHESSNLFVGIYTFEEDDITNCVNLQSSSSAITLGIPTPSKEIQINALSSKHFGPTSKIDTRRPIRVRQKVSSNFAGTPNSTGQKYHFTLEKETLGARNMKLLNVYL